MPVSTNFQVIGLGRAERTRIEQAVETAIGTRPGRWRVQFIGSLGEDVWEMRVSGPVVETAEYLSNTKTEPGAGSGGRSSASSRGPLLSYLGVEQKKSDEAAAIWHTENMPPLSSALMLYPLAGIFDFPPCNGSYISLQW